MGFQRRNSFHSSLTSTGNLLASEQLFHEDNPALQDATVHDALHKEQTHQPTAKPANKTVRFASHTKKITAPSRYCGIPAEDLWYTSDEFSSFHKTFHQDCKKMAKRDPSDNKAINDAFEHANKCHSKQSSSTPMDNKILNALRRSLKDRSKIGLERFSSRTVFRDKRTRRSELWEAVMDIQAQHGPQQGSSVGSEAANMQAEMMRVTCERISRPSVLFARYLAFGATKIELV